MASSPLAKMNEFSVEEIDQEQTLDLRRRVLYTAAHGDDSVPEDLIPTTFHLGVIDASGRVVVTSTFADQECLMEATANSSRLRKLATDPQVQGQGLGRLLLETAIAELQRRNYELLWAIARDTAIPFYERLGMDVRGDGFLHMEIPHHVVTLGLVHRVSR